MKLILIYLIILIAESSYQQMCFRHGMCYAARRVEQWWFSSLDGRIIFEKFADSGLLWSDYQPPSHPEPLGMQYLHAYVYTQE